MPLLAILGTYRRPRLALVGPDPMKVPSSICWANSQLDLYCSQLDSKQRCGSRLYLPMTCYAPWFLALHDQPAPSPQAMLSPARQGSCHCSRTCSIQHLQPAWWVDQYIIILGIYISALLGNSSVTPVFDGSLMLAHLLSPNWSCAWSLIGWFQSRSSRCRHWTHLHQLSQGLYQSSLAAAFEDDYQAGYADFCPRMGSRCPRSIYWLLGDGFLLIGFWDCQLWASSAAYLMSFLAPYCSSSPPIAGMPTLAYS